MSFIKSPKLHKPRTRPMASHPALSQLPSQEGATKATQAGTFEVAAEGALCSKQWQQRAAGSALPAPAAAPAQHGLSVVCESQQPERICTQDTSSVCLP